jgi:hypothetical protein
MLQKTPIQNDDRALIQLGEKLEQAWSHQLRRDNEAAYVRVAEIVRKIASTPARSLEGMRIKARAIAWCHAGEAPIFLTENPTTDVRIAESIVADLLAI